MRPELTELERIDRYLSGEMSGADRVAFENELQFNPDLAERLEHQQNFIQAAKRKALRAEIQTIAAAGGGGGGSFGSNTLYWGLGGIIAAVIAPAAIIYTNTFGEQAKNELSSPNNEWAQNASNPDQLIPDDALTFNYPQPETLFASTHTYAKEKSRLPVSKHVDNVVFEKEKNSLEIEVDTAENNGKKKVSDDIAAEYEFNRKAQFPGGYAEMKTFIEDNLHYPKTAERKGIEAVIRCDFMIMTTGEIGNIDAECTMMNKRDSEPLNGFGRLMNKRVENLFIENAKHVLRTMPVWIAATNSVGSSIVAPQRIYFKYDLEKGCIAYQLADEQSGER